MNRSTPASATPRAQRVLATMAFTLIGLSAVAVVLLLILRASGVPQSAFSSGPLVVLQLLPLPGLTIGLLLVIALILVIAVRRGRSGSGRDSR